MRTVSPPKSVRRVHGDRASNQSSGGAAIGRSLPIMTDKAQAERAITAI